MQDRVLRNGVETQVGEQKVSSGHFLRGETLVRGFPESLCEAEAPTEAVAETRTVFARFKAFPLRGRWILHRLAMQKTDEVSRSNAATYP